MIPEDRFTNTPEDAARYERYRSEVGAEPEDYDLEEWEIDEERECSCGDHWCRECA